MGYVGTRNGWGTTGGHVSGHPGVVGTHNERGDCCWGLCQHFWLASIIGSVHNARAHRLVWDLAAQTQTHDIDASPVKSHMTCLQPCIHIRPCMLEGFCFFVNITSSQLLFAHQHSFIQTTRVNSGSNDLVLDSLRYVGDTISIQTTYASLPCCFTTFLRMLWPSVDFQPWNRLHGRLSSALVGIPMHLGQDSMSRKGVRCLPPP